MNTEESLRISLKKSWRKVAYLRAELRFIKGKLQRVIDSIDDIKYLRR